MKILLVIVAAMAVVILSGGYYVFMTACRRKIEMSWNDTDALAQTQWAPLADRIREAARYLDDHNAQDLYTASHDGLKLHARWLPAENAVGTVLLFHGYRSCVLSDFAVYIPFYHSLGFNVLLADQRSHGKSEGKYITFGICERKDALTWIRCHNELLGRNPVYLIGMSMGASTVLMAAGENLPSNVRGVIADCGFTSPWEIIGEVMSQAKVPRFPLLQVAGIYTRLFAGFGLREYSTLDAMVQCKVPVLLFHGLDDHFVPSRMSQAAFDACKSEKQLILVEGASHGTACLTDRSRCQRALADFLMSHLED